MLQGLINFAMTLPAAAAVFGAAWAIHRYQQRHAPRQAPPAE